MNEKPTDSGRRDPSYAGKAVALGAGAGMIVGAVFDQPGPGMVIGAALGLVVGPLLRRGRHKGDSG